jgi:hypothetical protein
MEAQESSGSVSIHIDGGIRSDWALFCITRLVRCYDQGGIGLCAAYVIGLCATVP